MAISTDFPHDKLGYVLTGKKRTQLQNYDTRTTFDGQMLTRGVRDSSTVYFDVQIKVTQELALIFAIWLRSVKNGESFKITLNTESGMNEQTCKWAELPLSPQENDNHWIYSGVMYADVMSDPINDATDEQIDLVYNLGTDINPLDRLVNDEWPTL